VVRCGRSVPELSEHAPEKAFRLLFFDGRRLAAFFESREDPFDFAVNRKSAGARFRENQLSIHDHIELACFAGGDLRLLAESGIQ
jgi:hypothetical protein